MSATLEVPGGIADASSRVLVELLNARWDDLPIDRVLVWHTPSVQEDALPHLADTLGVLDLAYADATPRELPAKGVAFMRTRGTGGAIRGALETLGFPITPTLSRDTARYYDGTIQYNGLYRYGADYHWAVFFVTLTIDEPTDPYRIREVWDAVKFMKSQRDRVVLYVHDTVNDVTYVYRDGDLNDGGGLGGSLPLLLGG